MSVEPDPRLAIALAASLGAGLVTGGVLRWRRRRHMRARVRSLAGDWAAADPVGQAPRPRLSLMLPRVAGRLGAPLARRMPDQLGALATRVERAGLRGGTSTVELMGWKAIGVVLGATLGLLSIPRVGAGGLVILVLGILLGWFGVDLRLARIHARRRRQILRDLPTVIDLLVLTLEAGMGLDRALRTVARDFQSVMSDEIRRLLVDIDLGLARGEAFARMARRVGLDDLDALSRAIVQGEELGVSLVGVMQTQSREVRLSRRRAAEAEALRAPIKMLVPLVLFILPTLFILLLGPVALRAFSALAGKVP